MKRGLPLRLKKQNFANKIRVNSINKPVLSGMSAWSLFLSWLIAMLPKCRTAERMRQIAEQTEKISCFQLNFNSSKKSYQFGVMTLNGTLRLIYEQKWKISSRKL